jgi:hypothetical protein
MSEVLKNQKDVVNKIKRTTKHWCIYLPNFIAIKHYRTKGK